MKKIFTGIAIALSVALIDCSPYKVPHYTIDPGLKAYFNYQPGTYWVFYDSVSSEQDSLFVTYYGIVPNYAASSDATEEKVSIALKQSTANLLWRIDVEPSQVSMVIYSLPSYKDETAYFPLLRNFPFALGNNKGYYETTNTTLLPTMNVNGINATNVYRISYQDTRQSILDTVYLNKNQGYLQLNLNNVVQHHRWTLLRWNIVH